MARMPDLVAFAQRHGLKIGTIEDLIGYRLRHDKHRQAGGEDDGRQRASAAASICTSIETDGRAGRAPGPRQGRPRRAGPRAGARACRQRADRPAGRRRRGPARLADRESHADDRRGRPRRDRADPRLAAQIGVGVDCSERREQEPEEEGHGRAAAGRDRHRLADPARRSASATWCCSPTRRPRAMSASRPSGCASSASAGSVEAPWPARDSDRSRPTTCEGVGSLGAHRPHHRGALLRGHRRGAGGGRHRRARGAAAPPTSASPCPARWRSRRRSPRPSRQG